MSTTTQAAVKAALKTAILARTLISTGHIQVLYGEPGDEGRRETIWIGTAFTEGPQEPAAFRKGRRDEDYTVRVHCEAGLDATPEKAEARAVVFAGEVEQTVIADTTLGVAGVAWIRPDGIDLQTTEGDGSSRSIAVVRLACKARLQP